MSNKNIIKILIGLLMVFSLVAVVYNKGKELFYYSSNAYNISLKGKVMDKNTQEPIRNAIVYMDYYYFISPDIYEEDIYVKDTLLTDEKGFFEKKIDTVSCIFIQDIEKEGYNKIKSIMKCPKQDKISNITIELSKK